MNVEIGMRNAELGKYDNQAFSFSIFPHSAFPLPHSKVSGTTGSIDDFASLEEKAPPNNSGGRFSAKMPGVCNFLPDSGTKPPGDSAQLCS
ncbi:MAG: hypothetical protein V2I56_08755 [Desulfobacteraceae bacterium]|nr:hypothetical protein [Desulfobacteraceae bacterium]